MHSEIQEDLSERSVPSFDHYERHAQADDAVEALDDLENIYYFLSRKLYK